MIVNWLKSTFTNLWRVIGGPEQNGSSCTQQTPKDSFESCMWILTDEDRLKIEQDLRDKYGIPCFDALPSIVMETDRKIIG